MKISACNSLKGNIKSVTLGAISASVVLEVAPGLEITSVITRESVERLNLQEGKFACAIIKASSVMIGVD